jgi:hypothetical protein
MDSNPNLFDFAAPKGDHLEPPPSSHSIETSSYELHPDFIAMVREQSFSEDKDESPYSHLREFELCLCLAIAGMSQDVTEPPKIILYYHLRRSTWPLSNNKEIFCRLCRVMR